MYSLKKKEINKRSSHPFTFFYLNETICTTKFNNNENKTYKSLWHNNNLHHVNNDQLELLGSRSR